MKKLIIITAILLFSLIVIAQPAPPSTPGGNEIPVGNVSLGVVLAFGIYILFKNNEKQI